MFKILNGKAPTYLQELFSVRGIGYNIRNSEMRLNVPKPRTDYMKKSFCYSGAVLFNSLTQDIRKCQSLPKFKKAINKYHDNVIGFPHGNLVYQLISLSCTYFKCVSCIVCIVLICN